MLFIICPRVPLDTTSPILSPFTIEYISNSTPFISSISLPNPCGTTRRAFPSLSFVFSIAFSILSSSIILIRTFSSWAMFSMKLCEIKVLSRSKIAVSIGFFSSSVTPPINFPIIPNITTIKTREIIICRVISSFISFLTRL